MYRPQRGSVFQDGGLERLSIDYVPPALPHREEQLTRVVSYAEEAALRGLKTSPLVAIGPTGTGKTATIKLAIEKARKLARRAGVELLTFYTNCMVEDSDHAIIRKIATTLTGHEYKRGLSVSEILDRVASGFAGAAFIALDDVDEYLARRKSKLLHYLVSLGESIAGKGSVALVLAGREFGFIAREPILASRIRGNFVRFPPYSFHELIKIVEFRSTLSFKRGCIRDSAIMQVAFNSARYGSGDARYAVILLHRSGMVADQEGRGCVDVDCVRMAHYNFALYGQPKVSGISTVERLVLKGLLVCMKEAGDGFAFKAAEIVKASRLAAELAGVEVTNDELAQGLDGLERRGVVARVTGDEYCVPSLPISEMERLV